MSEDKKDALEACEEKVEELATENAELRESAESFGALAERLNQAKRADVDAWPVVCPRCSTGQHVQRTAPTMRGDDLHCAYCGNSWRSRAGDEIGARTGEKSQR